MKIQAPPGMRDFYPEDMRRQNWLFDIWRRVSESFGFEEYEGPIFEFLDLYTLKSGAGIVSELFNFTDRGGRGFALRPEMTPTLARMVAARANALPRPIKWFSLPRMCRAEKPQRGRLREFFQWNIDILGVDDVLADAEVIAVAVAALVAMGLSAEEVVVRISSRQIAAAALAALRVPSEKAEPAFQLIDRYDKLGPEEFRRQWDELAGGAVSAEQLQEYLTKADVAACLDLVVSAGEGGAAARIQFERLWELLDAFGVRPFCQFDLKVVRGLAYYTGPVFEVSARRASLRAILGGGRYDDLTSLLGGTRVPGVGFGMGDAPVLALLEELGKLPAPAPALDVFIIDAGEEFFPAALRLAGTLRAAGLRTDVSYKRQNVGKQFKQAAGRGSRFALVVGQEYADRCELVLKDLSSGEQRIVPAADLSADPRGAFGIGR